jgi:hypothetical protein
VGIKVQVRSFEERSTRASSNASSYKFNIKFVGVNFAMQPPPAFDVDQRVNG